MKKYLSLLSILIGILFFGQCPDSDVTLNSQAKVDAFKENYPNCTRLKTRLTISGSNITDLSGLSNLQIIDGYLDISYNNSLTNLSGLNNLTKVRGYLKIKFNPSLTSLSGLNNLHSIGRDLHINNNNALTDLSGLNNLHIIDRDLDILNNYALENFSGLNNLISVGGFFDIKNNSSLSSLSGLEKFEATGGYLQIKSNPKLTDLTGLNKLQSIGGVLVIFDNSTLSSLTGLDNVKTIVGYVDPNRLGNIIEHNAKKTPNSAEINKENYQDINIKRNPLLSKCAIKSICKSIARGKTIDIENNANSCNSYAEVYKVCGSLSVTNLNNNTEIKVYPNPTKDIINVQTNDSIEKIEIYSITGKLLDVFGSTNQVSTAKYSSGVYILLVYTDNGAYEQKIIKK